MSVNSQIRLIVPNEWGYGEEGYDDKVPPKAELIYVVKLLGIRDKEPPSIKRNRIIE